MSPARRKRKRRRHGAKRHDVVDGDFSLFFMLFFVPSVDLCL